jgi:hypothetical protein
MLLSADRSRDGEVSKFVLEHKSGFCDSRKEWRESGAELEILREARYVEIEINLRIKRCQEMSARG